MGDSQPRVPAGLDVDTATKIFNEITTTAAKVAEAHGRGISTMHVLSIGLHGLNSFQNMQLPGALHQPHLYSTPQMRAAALERLGQDLPALGKRQPPSVSDLTHKRQKNKKLTEEQVENIRPFLRQNKSVTDIVHDLAARGIKVSRQQIRDLRSGRTFKESGLSMHEQHSHEQPCVLSGPSQVAGQPPPPPG